MVRIDRAVYRRKVGLPKHDRVRMIELSPGLVAYLREHLKVVPPQVVQQLLGHARIEETMRYAHISPRMKRDAVRYLDELDAPGAQQGHMGSRLVPWIHDL